MVLSSEVASYRNEYAADNLLFATTSQMDTSIGQIEELTKLLDPEFEVDALLLEPHPFTLSIIEGKGVCVFVGVCENEARGEKV